MRAAQTGEINYSPVFQFLCSALRIYTLHRQAVSCQQDEEKLVTALERANILLNKIEAAAHKFPYEVAATLACGWTTQKSVVDSKGKQHETTINLILEQDARKEMAV